MRFAVAIPAVAIALFAMGSTGAAVDFEMAAPGSDSGLAGPQPGSEASFVPGASAEPRDELATISVDIRDFAYEPARVTVNAGDSVRWTNFDTADHSATDLEGAFDTGLFGTDQSESVRVSEPGTYEYVCSIHPEMQATLVVEGDRQGGGGGGGSDDPSNENGGGSDDDEESDTGTDSTSTGGTGSSTGVSGSGSLPTTGLELIWPLVGGALMLAAGLLLLALDRALYRPSSRL